MSSRVAKVISYFAIPIPASTRLSALPTLVQSNMSFNPTLFPHSERNALAKGEYQHHHPQRKPLTTSRSEKRPTLNVQSGRNSLSQWPTRTTAGANRRKGRHN